MTVIVATTTNTNTIEYWLNRTNELANAMSTVVVSTNSNTAAGDAAVTGSFTANSLIANTIVVSNSSVNTTIAVPNTTQISTGTYFLNANGNWSQIISPVTTSSFQTTGTSSQEIDNYSFIDFGGVEFFVRVSDNNANAYQATKILSFHNNVTAFSTEYGSMVSNNTLGTFAVSSNSTHVILNMTPTSSNTNVTISRVNF